MCPRGLAAKKMTLPSMDKLAFIDIALAQVREDVGYALDKTYYTHDWEGS